MEETREISRISYTQPKGYLIYLKIGKLEIGTGLLHFCTQEAAHRRHAGLCPENGRKTRRRIVEMRRKLFERERTMYVLTYEVHDAAYERPIASRWSGDMTVLLEHGE